MTDEILALAAVWNQAYNQDNTTPPPTALLDHILSLPAQGGGEGQTIAEYLAALAAGVWRKQVSCKYGITGESDWPYDLYEPIVEAGIVPDSRNQWDEYDHDTTYRCNALVLAAIRRLGEFGSQAGALLP